MNRDEFHRRLRRRFLLGFFALATMAILLFIVLLDFSLNSAVINPKGLIALKERNLMALATIFMLIIVVPVCLMAFFICLRYRATHKTPEYAPDYDHNHFAETIWWGFPCLIVLLLSYITWTSSFELDPFRPLASDSKPVKVQVVALQWKWLFIYPEENIATVNFFQFPEKTPINFEITADAPMNSFWLPQLGGQIYAMPGMNSKLHLIADTQGEFKGSSANISGTGFAGMTFVAKSSSEEDYKKWVESVKASDKSLDRKQYNLLAEPSENNPVELFSLKDGDLYNQIIMKFMMPPKEDLKQPENKQAAMAH